MPLRKDLLLTQRRKQILGAVVDLHVKTAQPVGSKTLVSEYRLNISPATVRLEFAVLEKLGLLFQPHTSAGRVPSDSGYRVFVDEILRLRPLPAARLRLWEQWLTQHYGEVKELMQAACRLLSQSTDYMAWAILPRRETEIIRGIHFSVLPDRRVVAMLLGRRLFHKAFLLPQTFDATLWQQATNWLHHRLQQIPLAHLLQTDWSQWATEEVSQNPVLPLAFQLLQRLAEEAWRSEVWIEGASRLLAEPEFQNWERTQGLIAFWESPQKFGALCTAILDRLSQKPAKVWVAIGSEIPFPELQECSLVAAPCFIEEYFCGMLGVLGPKRMRYASVIPVVEGISALTSQVLTTLLS